MGLLILIGIAGIAVYVLGRGMLGNPESAGEVTQARRAIAEVVERKAAQAAAANEVGVAHSKQILFGDFHVHTTFSTDAFGLSLPLSGGQGTRPPADACDFARHCSQLDFFSINDHAEGLSPRMWQETKDSLRQCAEVGQDPTNPDTVPFLGWEWTQIGRTPDDHYGHRNVVLPVLDEDRVPTRPIASRGGSGPPLPIRALIAASNGHPRFHDFARYWSELGDRKLCPSGVDVRELDDDCLEVAETPDLLFKKLEQWNLDTVVIPHGTAWGNYTPQGSSWDKQLTGDFYNADQQRMVELFSGHGSSEPYRDWRSVIPNPDGSYDCPEARPDFLPMCVQAGEIIRKRCLAAGDPDDECDAAAAEARKLAANNRAHAHKVVGASDPDEWLDAGQCRDCFLPAFQLRPMTSTQYMLARGNFDGKKPRHMQVGFMGSSDNHTGRAGSGYKEFGRRGMSDSMFVPGAAAAMNPLPTKPEESLTRARAFDGDPGIANAEIERFSSYMYTGGLIAVHASGRDRGSIWNAVKERQVYATSGPRMLLWFDLIDGTGRFGAPMGSIVGTDVNPKFKVRAVGSFEQKPGCPPDSGLSADNIERLCLGECYHPSDTRRRIKRIEVIRVRPQISPDEEIGALIEDPWMTHACPPNAAGCSFEFEDPEYVASERGAVYYVRAIETAAPAVNGAGIQVIDGETLRCPDDFDDDDCLAPHEPTAWSSPIFLQQSQ